MKRNSTKFPIRLAAAVLTLASTAALAQPYTRDQQVAACSDDAFRLCGDAIPDEGRVVACMAARRSYLSQSCRVVFDGSAPISSGRRR